MPVTSEHNRDRGTSGKAAIGINSGPEDEVEIVGLLPHNKSVFLSGEAFGVFDIEGDSCLFGDNASITEEVHLGDEARMKPRCWLFVALTEQPTVLNEDQITTGVDLCSTEADVTVVRLKVGSVPLDVVNWR